MDPSEWATILDGYEWTQRLNVSPMFGRMPKELIVASGVVPGEIAVQTQPGAALTSGACPSEYRESVALQSS